MPTAPNTIQIRFPDGSVAYPVTDVSCVMGLNGSAVTEAILCWDGASTPVVADIPAGVTVTYNGTTYTGTLAASSSTTGKIYMVATGTANNYDRYMTFAGGSSYVWENIGDTTIDLTTYVTQTQFSQLEHKVNGYSLVSGSNTGTQLWFTIANPPSADVEALMVITGNPEDIFSIKYVSAGYAELGAVITADYSKVVTTVPASTKYIQVNAQTGKTLTISLSTKVIGIVDDISFIEEDVADLSEDVDALNEKTFGVPAFNKNEDFSITQGQTYPRSDKRVMSLTAGETYKISADSATVGNFQCQFYYNENNNEYEYVNLAADGTAVEFTPTHEIIKLSIYVADDQALATGTLTLNIHQDAIPGVDEEIEKKVTADVSVNLFDKTEEMYHGYYASAFEPNEGYRISGPIKVENGKTYKCPHSSSLGVNASFIKCGRDGTFISAKYGTISGDYLLLEIDFDGYVEVNIGPVAGVDSFMFCESAKYPDAYVAYKNEVGPDYGLGEKQVEQVREMIAPLEDLEDYFQDVESVNLFDKTNTLIKNGYYGSGQFNENANYRVTHPIAVKGGVTYKAFYNSSSLGANNQNLAIVTNDNTILSIVNGTISGETITYTPASDCYLSFNVGWHTVGLDAMMVCKSSEYPNEYVPYYNYVKLNGVVVDGESRLFGKSVIFTGDSICAGAADTPQGAGYAKRIGEKNKMVWQNKAVSGGTIMDKDLIGSSFTISETDFGTGADYIILEGGTNDADRIGSILNGGTPTYYGSWDETDYLTTFGKSTFCDAVQRLIQRVVTSFPSAKVGFIIAMKMGVTSNGYTKDTNNRRAYFETIIQICKKWGVPVLNLWDECTMNPRLESHYTSGEDYLYADGQHPTANGYEVMTPIIEAWMETL